MMYESIGLTFFISFFDLCSVQETKIIFKLEDYGPNILCKIQPNGFDCDGKGLTPHRFYYDTKMGDCKTAKFGQCKNSHINNFSTRERCNEQCRDAGQQYITQNVSNNIFCRLQPEFGFCHSYVPMWYFDVTQRICRGFSYSGCGGNMNRFPTSQICTSACSNAFVY